MYQTYFKRMYFLGQRIKPHISVPDLTNPTFTEHTDNRRVTDVPKVADVEAD